MEILIVFLIIIKITYSGHNISSFCEFHLGPNDEPTCRLWNAFVMGPNQVIKHKTDDFLRWENHDITHMYAEESQLTYITPVIFEKYRNLLEAKFEDVFMEKIENDTFYNCEKLITLSLAKNNLSEIPENSFKNCSNIEKINLSKNRISTINSNAFNGLSHLKELNLEENKINQNQSELSEIPGLKILNLASNDLTIPPNNLIHNLNLKELSMANNNMIDIPEEFFKNSQNLTDLYLNNNNLDFLQKTPFSALANLEKLHLQSNKILSIQVSLLSNLTNLIELHLEDNMIQYINDNSFDNLKSLKKLLLSNNEFKAQNENPRMNLENLKNLEILDLSSNAIVQLDKNFVMSSNMKELNLSNNIISFLHEDVFKTMKDLEMITMAFNNLTSLSDATFANNVNLREVDLSNNHIRRVEGVLFESLIALEKLNLSSNMITQISPEFQGLLENTLNSTIVDLTNNICVDTNGNGLDIRDEIEQCVENYVNNVDGDDSTTEEIESTTENKNPENGACSKFCYNLYIFGVTYFACLAFNL